MLKEENKETPRILYSCYSHISREGEQFVPQHIFGCIISGSSEMYIDGKTYSFGEGDFRFIRKNQLSKFVKHPPSSGGDFKTISIGIDQQTLHSISEEYNLRKTGTYTGENALVLKPNNLFKNYTDSLMPYLNGPGKIDLEAFMNKNFHFNVQLNRFAYLTGRSLATFKRDFEKIFHITPSRWLLQKRLQEAHYLIKEKGKTATDVYLDLGFEDLSHFSFAFKKAFGVAPSRLGI